MRPPIDYFKKTLIRTDEGTECDATPSCSVSPREWEIAKSLLTAPGQKLYHYDYRNSPQYLFSDHRGWRYTELRHNFVKSQNIIYADVEGKLYTREDYAEKFRSLRESEWLAANAFFEKNPDARKMPAYKKVLKSGTELFHCFIQMTLSLPEKETRSIILAIIQKAGAGSFARVSIGTTQEGESYAIKSILRTKSQTENDKALIENELTIASELGFFLGDTKYNGKFRFLMRAYPNGDLISYSRKVLLKNQLDVKFAYAHRIFYHVIRELSALHDKGLLHCDIKPDNILIDKNGFPKLGDFTLAARADAPSFLKCGTFRYLAPELLDADKNKQPWKFSKETDYYALGKTIEVFFNSVFGKKGSPAPDATVLLLKNNDPKKRPHLHYIELLFYCIPKTERSNPLLCGLTNKLIITTLVQYIMNIKPTDITLTCFNTTALLDLFLHVQNNDSDKSGTVCQHLPLVLNLMLNASTLSIDHEWIKTKIVEDGFFDTLKKLFSFEARILSADEVTAFKNVFAKKPSVYTADDSGGCHFRM